MISDHQSGLKWYLPHTIQAVSSPRIKEWRAVKEEWRINQHQWTHIATRHDSWRQTTARTDALVDAEEADFGGRLTSHLKPVLGVGERRAVGVWTLARHRPINNITTISSFKTATNCVHVHVHVNVHVQNTEACTCIATKSARIVLCGYATNCIR